MLTAYGPTNNGKATLVKSAHNGPIALFAFAPFWISTVRNVESLSGGPPGGFNFEMREGIYIVPPATGLIQPIDWNGDIYVLNGTGPLDSVYNVIVCLPMSLC
jgi:hypothetical protein